jgi:hypothetical protein
MDIIEYVDPPAEKIVFSDDGAEWYGEMADKPSIEQTLFFFTG